MEKEILKRYYIEKAKVVSMDFEEHEKTGLVAVLGDYLTEDIANDWLDEDVEELRELCLSCGKNDTCAVLYEKINENFMRQSTPSHPGEEDQSVWTLEALKNSSFWHRQRQLARALLGELEKL